MENNTLELDNGLFYFIEIDMEGNYTYMNDKFKSHFIGDLYAIGTKAMLSVAKEDRAKCAEVVNQCFEKPKKRHSVLLKKPLKDGFVTNHWEFRPNFNSDGIPKGVISIGYELSDLIDHTNGMREVVNELTLENDAINETIYKLGHDLRSPIATLKGLLKIYEDKSSEQIDIQLISTLVNNLDKKVRILNQKQEEIALQIENYSEINFNDIIRDSLKPYTSEILEKGHLINLNIRAKGFKSRLEYVQSIVENLVSNCFKYKSESTKLSLNFEVSRIENDSVEIKIEDNGIGIDLNKNGKFIFKPYQTFTNRQGSNGLGLYLVKRQITELGGTISLESELGEGTKIRIIIPSI